MLKGVKEKRCKKFETRGEAESFIQVNQISKTAIIHRPLIEHDEIDYYVYTDGACSNNGKASACAGIGIFFGKDDIRNVSRKVVGKQTNNTAELTAIIDTYPVIYLDLVSVKKSPLSLIPSMPSNVPLLTVKNAAKPNGKKKSLIRIW